MRAQMNLPGGMDEPTANLFGWVVACLAQEGGTLTFMEDPSGTNTVGLEFGKEAEDPPMAGGAAYGVGSSLKEAFERLLDNLGVEANSVAILP